MSIGGTSDYKSFTPKEIRYWIFTGIEKAWAFFVQSYKFSKYIYDSMQLVPMLREFDPQLNLTVGFANYLHPSPTRQICNECLSQEFTHTIAQLGALFQCGTKGSGNIIH